MEAKILFSTFFGVLESKTFSSSSDLLSNKSLFVGQL